MCCIPKNKALEVWEKQFGEKKETVDFAGRQIKLEEHGNNESEYGWNIDHIKPQSLGGVDDIENLIVCNMKTNQEKDCLYPIFIANNNLFYVNKGEIIAAGKGNLVKLSKTIERNEKKSKKTKTKKAKSKKAKSKKAKA